MLTGKRFRLRAETLVVGQSGTGHAVAITIPAGGIVNVVADFDKRGMVDVLWDGQVVEIFQIDLVSRGEALSEALGAHN